MEANAPHLVAHHAYVNEDQMQVSLLQIHADAASAENHMQVAGEWIGRGLQLSDTVRVEVYGTPGPVVQQALEANAAAGVTVDVKTSSWGGFSRS